MDHVGVWAWMPYVWNVYVFVSSSQLKYHTRSQILCIYSSLFCSLFCFMSFCCNWAIFVIILLLLLLLFGQWMCSHSRKNFWCSFTQTLCENRPTDQPNVHLCWCSPLFLWLLKRTLFGICFLLLSLESLTSQTFTLSVSQSVYLPRNWIHINFTGGEMACV